MYVTNFSFELLTAKNTGKNRNGGSALLIRLSHYFIFILNNKINLVSYDAQSALKLSRLPNILGR